MLRQALLNSTNVQLASMDPLLMPYFEELLQPVPDCDRMQFQFQQLYQNKTLDISTIQDKLLGNLAAFYLRSKANSTRAVITEQFLLLVEFAGDNKELRLKIEGAIGVIYTGCRSNHVDVVGNKHEPILIVKLNQLVKIFDAHIVKSKASLDPESLACFANCLKIIAENHENNAEKITFYSKAMSLGDIDAAFSLASLREKAGQLDAAIACYQIASRRIQKMKDNTLKTSMLIVLQSRVGNLEGKLSPEQNLELAAILWQIRLKSIINDNYEKKTQVLRYLSGIAYLTTDAMQRDFILQTRDYFSGQKTLFELAQKNYLLAVCDLASIYRDKGNVRRALYLSTKSLLLLSAPSGLLTLNYGISAAKIEKLKKQAKDFLLLKANHDLEYEYKNLARWFLQILNFGSRVVLCNPDVWLLKHASSNYLKSDVIAGMKQALNVDDKWIQEKSRMHCTIGMLSFFKKPTFTIARPQVQRTENSAAPTRRP